MAEIANAEDFLEAVGYLVDQGELPVQGERQIVASERKVYDRRPNPNPPPAHIAVDITPAQAVLEAALDAALAETGTENEIDQAREALQKIRQYRQRQLIRETPDTPAQQVTRIKELANGNAHLTRVMTNKINEKNGANGWSLTLNPNNLQTRQQFIETIDTLLGVLP